MGRNYKTLQLACSSVAIVSSYATHSLYLNDLEGTIYLKQAALVSTCSSSHEDLHGVQDQAGFLYISIPASKF